MGEAASLMSENASGVGALRLSPVEKANLSLINDPALDGYQVQGRTSFDDALSMRYMRPEIDVEAESDPTYFGKVVQDVITIGPEIKRIGMGANGPWATKSVEVDVNNPFFSTDGLALFNKDGSTLIKLIVNCESYTVPKTCKHIGLRAFDSASNLKECKLNNGLETIERLAFAKSGIVFVDIPASVLSIGEKAFYCCKSMTACTINDSVERIGDMAFALSALERMHIPASVTHIGHEAFSGARAQKIAGAISVSRNSNTYTVDSQGGLYKGKDFAELLSNVCDYVVRPGTERILKNAFRRNMKIRRVEVPEGVEFIGDGAFRSCKNLTSVELPESLAFIGESAFMDTRIKTLFLSKNIFHIGDDALLVQGTNPSRQNSPLQSVELDSQNNVFYMEAGILCERGGGEEGADKALCYVGSDPIVYIPAAVNRIAPYAFLGAGGIEELHIHSNMHSICAGSLSVGESIPRIIVDLPARSGESAATVSLPVPSLSSRYRTFTDLFTTDNVGTVFVFPYYDSWVTNTSAVSEFAPAAITRLREPIHLREDFRDTYLSILERKQQQVCAFFAEQGDISALIDLADWGVLSSLTVKECLQGAMEENSAIQRACLLELIHRKWSDRNIGLICNNKSSETFGVEANQSCYELDLSI